MAMITKQVDKKSNVSSRKKIGLNVMGRIKPLTLSMRIRLKIFEPIILPMTRSDFFFVAATMAVINSGKDVPMATVNKAIKASDKFNVCAMVMAD